MDSCIHALALFITSKGGRVPPVNTLVSEWGRAVSEDWRRMPLNLPGKTDYAAGWASYRQCSSRRAGAWEGWSHSEWEAQGSFARLEFRECYRAVVGRTHWLWGLTEATNGHWRVLRGRGSQICGLGRYSWGYWGAGAAQGGMVEAESRAG